MKFLLILFLLILKYNFIPIDGILENNSLQEQLNNQKYDDNGPFERIKYKIRDLKVKLMVKQKHHQYSEVVPELQSGDYGFKFAKVRLNNTTIIDTLVGVNSTAVNDSCSQTLLKQPCFDKIKCGWCEKSQSCVLGTINGPIEKCIQGYQYDHETYSFVKQQISDQNSSKIISNNSTNLDLKKQKINNNTDIDRWISPKILDKKTLSDFKH